jgi:hypothetical protein
VELRGFEPLTSARQAPRSPDGGAASGSAGLDSEGPPPHRRLLPPTLCFPPVRVIFAFVLIGLRCIRIPIEEKALRAGLEGYDEYAAHVRYGLIPHVW